VFFENIGFMSNILDDNTEIGSSKESKSPKPNPMKSLSFFLTFLGLIVIIGGLENDGWFTGILILIGSLILYKKSS
jgi:hypothetical protein